MTSISSLSFSNPIRSSISTLEQQLTSTETEISTGTKADLGLSLGAQTGNALSLESEIDKLNGFTGTNSLVTARLSATSSALTGMISTAQSMAQALTEGTGVGGSSTLQTSAASALQSLVGTLNTTSGDQFIFGGINTKNQPIAAYTSTAAGKTAIDTAFQTYLSSNGLTAATISASQMQSFLDGPLATQFNDTNWAANWSSASGTAIQSNISPTQALTSSISANDTSFRQVTQAYTMLTELAGQGLNQDALSSLVSTASKLMSSGINGMNTLEGQIGVAQGVMDSTATKITDQVQVLTTSVNSMTGVDPATLSTQITQLQTQLQASYELTAQLSKLSLVNYLSA